MPGRRLYRSRVDCKIAGVCGGIAEYFDIDPVFVRVAAFLLTFPHGLGVIAYLICWAAIPLRPEAAGEPGGGTAEAAPGIFSPAQGPMEARPSAPGAGELIAGGALILAGLFFLMLNMGIFDWEIFRFWRWRLVWPLLLIGLGVYIVSVSVRTRHEGAGKGRL